MIRLFKALAIFLRDLLIRRTCQYCHRTLTSGNTSNFCDSYCEESDRLWHEKIKKQIEALEKP